MGAPAKKESKKKVLAEVMPADYIPSLLEVLREQQNKCTKDKFTFEVVDGRLYFEAKEQQPGWVLGTEALEVDIERLKKNKEFGGNQGHGLLRVELTLDPLPAPKPGKDYEEDLRQLLLRFVVRNFRGYVISRQEFEATRCLRGCMGDIRSVWHKLAATWQVNDLHKVGGQTHGASLHDEEKNTYVFTEEWESEACEAEDLETEEGDDCVGLGGCPLEEFAGNLAADVPLPF